MPILIDQPKVIRSAGDQSKAIREYFGRVRSDTEDVSVAHMRSPAGWSEPGQTPEFDEYTLVLHGTLRVESRSGTLEVGKGQAVLAHRGEWIRYSTPASEGAEYVAICLPAFSPDLVHRDD